MENVDSEVRAPRKWPWIINIALLALVVWSLVKMIESRNPPPVTEGGVESGVIDSTLVAPAWQGNLSSNARSNISPASDFKTNVWRF